VPLLDRDLEDLYRECRQQLFTCALAITRSAERAEDAVHNAFCEVLRRKRKPNDLKAYVFQSVRNAARDQVRRRAIRGSPLPDSIFDPGRLPSQSAEDAELRRRAVASIEDLSADEQETVVQHLYGELTFQQIATIRAAPLGTVVSWYRRGLEKLRTRLGVTDGSL
jgi:RNA polymerase sigma-70 factor (ECF subfamily)